MKPFEAISRVQRREQWSILQLAERHRDSPGLPAAPFVSSNGRSHQIARVLSISELSVITADVVEAASSTLVLGAT